MENAISARQFVETVAFLLREAFEGTPEGMPNAFLDKGVSFFATLKGTSAENASANVDGTTIAAHTEHAKFYLDRLCEFLNGENEPVNWEASWLIETVNQEEWEALQASVRKAYERTLICLADKREWSETRVGMAIGMVAHTAYHLGAIRQLAKRTSYE